MQNETPAVSTVAARPPWYAPLVSAAARIDVATWIAVGLTFAGWFLMDTLRVQWGPIDRRVSFFDLPVLLSTPARMFTGIEGHRGFSTFVFVTICCLTLLTPFLPQLWRNKYAWLACVGPLVLMVVAALLFYWRTRDVVIPEDHSFVDTIANDLRHLARHVLHSAQAGVARRVFLASGGYLAAAGALFLAVRGVRGFRTFRK